MPSRYCCRTCSATRPGRPSARRRPATRRVQASCDHVHEPADVRAGQQHAADHGGRRLGGRRGVCRDFAHLAAQLPAAPSTSRPGTSSATCPTWTCRRTRSRWTSPPGWRSGWAAAGGPSTRATTRRRKGRVLIGRGRDAVGRGDGDHVRRPGAGADGGLGRGGRGAVTAWLDRPLLELDSVDLDGRRVGHLPAAPGASATPTTARRTTCGSGWSRCPGPGTATCTGGRGTSRSPTRRVGAPARRPGRRRQRGRRGRAAGGRVGGGVHAGRAGRAGRPAAGRAAAGGRAGRPAAAGADPADQPVDRSCGTWPSRCGGAPRRRVVGRAALCLRLRAELTFTFDATTVTTTAAEAYALRRGVCQDIAHVMLTVCRLAGIPARYVSGHLLGEQGGSHAWVEVLVPDGAGARALGFDPTNGCRAGGAAPAGRGRPGLRRCRAHLGRLHRLRPRPPELDQTRRRHRRLTDYGTAASATSRAAIAAPRAPAMSRSGTSASVATSPARPAGAVCSRTVSRNQSRKLRRRPRPRRRRRSRRAGR